MVKCNKNDPTNSCRTFQVFGSGIGYKSPNTSYYKGKTPSAVAKKFGSMLFRLINDETSDYYKYRHQKTIKFIMRETTRGSDKATFYYKAEHILLPNPVERKLPNGKMIVNKYKTVIHKCGADPEIENIISSSVDVNKTTTTQSPNKTETVTTQSIELSPNKKGTVTKKIIVENIKIEPI